MYSACLPFWLFARAQRGVDTVHGMVSTDYIVIITTQKQLELQTKVREETVSRREIRHKDHNWQADLRIYANQTARPFWPFSQRPNLMSTYRG